MDKNYELDKDASLSDWLSGGSIGSRQAVLTFRSCVLATPTSSNNTLSSNSKTNASNILLNKAKHMAKRLAAEPHSYSVRPKNIMHDVMETFGNTNKFATSPAFIVKHKSEEKLEDPKPEDKLDCKVKRGIDDVLNDLSKITLKKNLNIINTTANIKVPSDSCSDENDFGSNGCCTKENVPNINKNAHKKNSKGKNKTPKKGPQVGPLNMQSDDSVESIATTDQVKILESNKMPARMLNMTYKLVNTETKLLHKLLQAHGMQEVDANNKEFNLLWGGLHPKPDVLRSLSPYQRVNHFPRSYELTRKDKLFKNIEKMQYFRGVKHFDFIPMTFLMPTEYKELCTTHYRTKGPWIVKPAASSRGRGIYIVNTPEQIPKGESVVVAKYIDRPLLVGGHKCDLRLYACLTSIDPLLLYLYEEGLVRFATVKYDKTNKNLWNPCMHLCNYSINKYHTDYVKCDDAKAGNIGHKWTLSALLRHLRKQGRDTISLMAAIEDLVVKAILSGAHTIAVASRVFVPHFNNCFELFGFDILIDDMLKPWLLEINLSPSLGCDSPLDARVKSALLADTLTLVGVPAVPLNTSDQVSQAQQASCKNVSLKMRIGACRRVHSAENMSTGRRSYTASGASSLPLTGEEARLVRAVRAQYARRGGYVRIFPSQNSWQKYAQYLDPVSGVPICSTSLNNSGGFSVVVHNYNLLIHTHVLPNFQASAPITQEFPERLKRYERVMIAGQAPAVQISDRKTPPQSPSDIKNAKELIKRQLNQGLKLTPGEVRRAFGLFLTHVLKRIANPCNEQAGHHADLLLKFLKRASTSLKIPYNIKGPSQKMCDKDKCAVIAKQLGDFLYMYYRETDLYSDTQDQEGCVTNIHFAQFMVGASEADLEDVLLLVLQQEHYVTPFLGDSRNPLCVDMPASKMICPKPRGHLLLRQLACLSTVNARRFKHPELPITGENGNGSENHSLDEAISDILMKESLRVEKPLKQALEYARS